ncbi:acetyltransferase [Legionella dresdenensis]|uniref:Acetyltransferase n=1 Tax=Legionella dresdenensis TaxID=450200 RepID=A0ABV8CCB0_9GAMM
MKKLIIFGITDAAELAHYYFSRDTEYHVTAFSVDREYLDTDRFCGLPVVPFEQLAATYPPNEYDLFIALGYSNLNQNRKMKYYAAREMGYRLASYISPHATVLNNNIGDNCFILEDNTIQPFVTIGNNVTLWSGNHIGHHSRIGDHCFLASHIVISGRVEIGECCFIGVNATFRDHITVGAKTIIGAGSLILSSCEPEGVYIGSATERSRVPSHRLKKI